MQVDTTLFRGPPSTLSRRSPKWDHVVVVTLSSVVLTYTCTTLGLTLGKVFYHEFIGDAGGVLVEFVGDQPRTNDSESHPVTIEATQIEFGHPCFFACPSGTRPWITC
jgi:hypothetical protein